MKRRHLAAIVAVLAMAALTGCGHSTPKPAAVTVPSPTPSPSPTHLDERAACLLLAPAVVDATTIIKDITAQPDGSTVDQATLASVIATMQQVQQSGPPDLQEPLATVAGPLEALQGVFQGSGNTQLQTLSFALAASTITDNCAPYVGG